MFSFRKAQNYFVDNPIARAELAYLRRQASGQSPWLRWPGNILFAFAALLALLPTVLTMFDYPRTYMLLPIIIATVFLVHFSVTIRTLTLASYAIAREKETNNWDALVLTGQDARQIIRAKFWAVIRCVWGQHILAALLKLGLAYGLAQFFFYISRGTGCTWGNSWNYDPYTSVYWPSSWLYMSPVLVVIVGLGLLEAGFLAGLGIFMSLLNSQRRLLGVTGAVAIRTILILVAFSLWMAMTHKNLALNDAVRNHSTKGFLMGLSSQGLVFPNEWQDLMGMIQLAVSPLIDDGTVFSATMIRPFPPLNYSMRLFIALGAGSGVFLLLIYACLWAAQRLAIRQSALRPAFADTQPSSTMMRKPTG